MENYFFKNIIGEDIVLKYNDVTKRLIDEWKPPVGNEIFLGSPFQQELYKFLFDGYESKKITVLDIGSNAGFFSIFCAPICEKVYAIEPSAIMCRTIKEFTSDLKNVIVCNNAISRIDGMINFFFFPDCTGQSTIHNRAKAKNAEANFCPK